MWSANERDLEALYEQGEISEAELESALEFLAETEGEARRESF